MVAWVVELSEYGLIYEQRKAIKAQVLVDFILEMTKPEGEMSSPGNGHSMWTVRQTERGAEQE